MSEKILLGLVLLMALGSASQWLAWRLRVPSILVLLVVGFVVGPVLGVLAPDELLGPVTLPLVSLGAAVVLFEGGLTASWGDIRTVAGPVRRLITLALLATWGGTTLAAYWLLGFGWELAALLGAILVVTGPTVIGPLLRHSRPRGRVGRILKIEGVLNDPLGAILAVLVFQVIQAEQVSTAVSVVALGVAKSALLASVFGAGAAWGYVLVRRREWLPESLENAVLLPLALGVYALAGMVQQESGLLAVTIMGIALASQHRVGIEACLEFTAHARTMLISVLFVLLTARMEVSDLTELPLAAALFVGLVIFVLRPVAVLLATVGTSLSWTERFFLGAIAPRGIVAAAVSSVFSLRLVEAGYEAATLLLPITFVVIAACVAVYGLSARSVVRVLGLSQGEPQGLLLLGANRVARVIASSLQEQELRVLLVDSDSHLVKKARLSGLDAEHGELLSDRVLDRIDLDGIGHFLAVSPADDKNTLAATHFRKVFGSMRAYQLNGSNASSEKAAHGTNLGGAHLAGGRSYDEVSSWVHRGATGKVTQLTKEFSYEDYQAVHAGAVPLFSISKDGVLRILGQDSKEPVAGDRVVSLVQPPATPCLRDREPSPVA